MYNELDWLLRPVRARLCSLKELRDGTYSLLDVAILNDMLTVEQENNFRYSDAAKRG